MIGSAHVLPNWGMKFHFIGIVKGGYTTITDPDGKPRIICFSKKKTANECIDYILSLIHILTLPTSVIV